MSFLLNCGRNTKQLTMGAEGGSSSRSCSPRIWTMNRKHIADNLFKKKSTGQQENMCQTGNLNGT